MYGRWRVSVFFFFFVAPALPTCPHMGVGGQPASVAAACPSPTETCRLCVGAAAAVPENDLRTALANCQLQIANCERRPAPTTATATNYDVQSTMAAAYTVMYTKNMYNYA